MTAGSVSPQQPGVWEVKTPGRGVASDVVGQVIITLFIVLPLMATILMLMWWAITLGPRWPIIPMALSLLVIGRGWWRCSRRYRIHSIRFDGQRLWLGRSSSFPPSDVCMLEAIQRPGRALSHVAVWREGVRRYSRVYFGAEDLLTVCQKLDELCPHAVKIWMPGEIVLPEGLNRQSPGFRRLRWFFFSRIRWSVLAGLLFLGWGTVAMMNADGALQIACVVFADLFACLVFWRAWHDLRAWMLVRRAVPEGRESKS